MKSTTTTGDLAPAGDHGLEAEGALPGPWGGARRRAPAAGAPRARPLDAGDLRAAAEAAAGALLAALLLFCLAGLRAEVVRGPPGVAASAPARYPLLHLPGGALPR